VIGCQRFTFSLIVRNFVRGRFTHTEGAAYEHKQTGQFKTEKRQLPQLHLLPQ
jgi:hypothetical protein